MKKSGICNQVTPPVKGEWGDWGSWSSCDDRRKERTRTRQCNGGADKICPGSSHEAENCMDGEWSDWGSWSACDGRRKARRRSCDNPPPINNGAYCPGPPVQEQICDVLIKTSTDGFEIGTDYNNHEKYCSAFPHLDFCQEIPASNPSSPATSISSTIEPSTQDPEELVCYDTSKDTCACGQPQCDTKEISGGRIAKPHQYPWIVRLVGGCAGTLCAGTLVIPRVILSAFHCTIKPPFTDITEPCDHSDGKRLAIFGRHEIHQNNIRNYNTIPVINVLAPEYPKLEFPTYLAHDFALLILQRPARYTSKVSPICLPEPGAEFGGLQATAAGWGRTGTDSVNQSPVLKAVELTVSPKQYYHKKMFGTELSKKDNVYQDPCSGDSGGPLMYYNQTTSRYVLIGTVQGEGYNCRTGGVGSFEGSDNGVWNKVSAHMEWIKDTMEGLGENICKADSG